jgi:hypothetical protein
VRAMMGTAADLCWIGRQEAADIPRAASASVTSTGVLGHQAGGGAAVVSGHGAVAGKAGRCQGTESAAGLVHWDVIYSHKGVEHQVQLSDAPGKTIDVNARGEPRQ